MKAAVALTLLLTLGVAAPTLAADPESTPASGQRVSAEVEGIR